MPIPLSDTTIVFLSPSCLIAKVVSVIEENMENTEFNVTMLSDLMDIDGKQLYRKLKQLTGSSPVDYIRQIRMKKAAVLLAQKKFSIFSSITLTTFASRISSLD